MRRVSASEAGLLVLRLGFAALLVGFHGWTRFHKAFAYTFLGQPWSFVDMVGRLGFPFPPLFAVLSALAESVAVLFVAAGLFTRWAAGLVAVNMAVAVISEFSKGDPIELPGLYLLGALAIVLLGPGRLSIDPTTAESRTRRPTDCRRR